MTDLLLVGGLLAGVFLASYVVEALRSPPDRPERLLWDPAIPVQYVELDGQRVRYIVTGEGSPLVLLHTLRTQLDMFQKVIPDLARHHRVYALDYPGHGWSDIPRVDYTPEFFVRVVGRFLDRLDIRDATLAGESIGGSIALLLTARRHPRVRRVIAVNPYDYDRGRGVRRSSTLANLIFATSRIPLLGATVMRLRNSWIERGILAGGVHRKGALPASLVREMYAVGNREGHYQAFLSLVRNWPDWERARSEYPQIQLPVLLLYGEHDWSRPGERAANLRDIPNAQMRVVPNAGHFLALDAPEDFIHQITEFIATTEEQPRSVDHSTEQIGKEGVSP
jgi:pimeloyl-ACP methyl ester carboxylesterase